MTSLTKLPSYAVIIQAIHCRGAQQNDALLELKRRRLWLSSDQKRQAAWPKTGRRAV